jgi:hypothetical protein
MEPRREIDLAAELRALRPAPRPAFAAQLDERAAAGFPRRSFAGSPFARLVAWLQSIEPRRMLLPAGATAFAAIAVATAVIGTTSERTNGPALTVQTAIQRDRRAGPLSELSEKSSETAASAAVGEASARATNDSLFNKSLPTAPGPYASHVAHRDVERSAQIVLGAAPADVRDDAAKVFETVQAYHGIVLHSSIRDGSGGEGGASFDLLIPSGKLGAAMAAFSEIAEVRSRSEATADVTAPTIGLGERLQDARAKVESLLRQLAGAETEAERKAAEAKLRSARRHVAALRTRLTSLQRRTHLSSVSLRIETGGEVGHGGGWDVGNALHDAGRILAIAAGVALVGLAILVPVALICLLAWLAQRTWARRSRERALG